LIRVAMLLKAKPEALTMADPTPLKKSHDDEHG